MKIQTKALELISRSIGEHSSGQVIVDFLKDQGVPPELIVYPNTKWRMVFDVLFHLSNSPDTKSHSIFLKTISAFLHPLNFNGNEQEALKAISEFNQWLKYDKIKFELTDDGVKEIHPKTFGEYDLEQYDQYQYDQMREENTGEAISIIKSQLSNDLVLLKKSYQIMTSIVETALSNTSHPDDKLNDFYLKLSHLAESSKNKIFDTLKKAELGNVIFDGHNFYKPFKNIYSIEAEMISNSPQTSAEVVMAKMNEYLGEITELCFLCSAGDVLNESNTQLLFNDISLHLTKLKENQDSNTIPSPTTQKTIVKYDKEKSTISANNKEITIPYATNQSNFCEALFQKPKKRWENDELLDKFGDNTGGTDVKRQPYDAMIAINKKVSNELGISDLIISSNKTFQLNPKYLP